MDYSEFMEALVRISIKGKHIFNKFTEKFDTNTSSINTAMDNIIKDEK